MNERLKRLRKELGLTQREFADRIGIKQNTLATYEIGRNEPIDAVISLICLVFDVNETWLRTGEGEIFRELSSDEKLSAFFGDVMHDEKETFKKRLFTRFSELNESEWAILEKIFEGEKKA